MKRPWINVLVQHVTTERSPNRLYCMCVRLCACVCDKQGQRQCICESAGLQSLNHRVMSTLILPPSQLHGRDSISPPSQKEKCRPVLAPFSSRPRQEPINHVDQETVTSPQVQNDHSEVTASSSAEEPEVCSAPDAACSRWE